MASAAADDYCDTCGIVAPKDQLVTSSDATYCPPCAPAKQFNSRTAIGWVFHGLFALAVFLIFKTGEEDFRLPQEQVLLIGALVYVLLTIVHELGHAAMAKLTGHRLVGVVIGHGRHRLARKRVRGVFFELRLNLTGGTMHAAGGSSRFGRIIFHARRRRCRRGRHRHRMVNERWRDAVDVLAPLELWVAGGDETRAVVLNNIAWSALMTFDAELITAAERWSSQAAELLPVLPAISSNQGRGPCNGIAP